MIKRQEEEFDYMFKIVMVGNIAVGKTTILKRLIDNVFQEKYQATIGVDFGHIMFNVNGNIVKLQIWDTAAQERFRALMSSYYRGAHGIFVVYDITNEQTFRDIDDFWFNQVEKFSDPIFNSAYQRIKQNLNPSWQINRDYVSQLIKGILVRLRLMQRLESIFYKLLRIWRENQQKKSIQIK